MSYQSMTIGEFCKTGSGGTPSRKQLERYYGGNIPWVKSGELREGTILETKETITEVALKETSAKLIPANALLVAMYGATIGRVAVLGIEASSNQAVCHIVPNDEVADRRYLFYALRQKVPVWLNRGVGGAQPNISQQIIRNTPIPLPGLEEQKRIAAILDKADAIRQKRKKAIALTEELLRSTFLDMFGEPVGRKQAWKQHNLSELVTIVSGQVDPKIEPYIDMPHIGGTNIESNTGFIHEVQTPRELNLISGKYLFEPTDILLSKIRPYLNKVAIPGFSGVCSADIYPLRINEKIVDRNYLLYLLHSSEFLNYAEKHSARTNIPKINRSALLKFCSKLPPIELQRQFSQIFTSIYSIKRSFDSSLDESTNCFNSLLQKAFRGEL